MKKKALIIHHSKTGRTSWYAHAIATHLSTCNVEAQVTSIRDFKPAMLDGVQHVLLGCWTHGLMVVLQHPEQEWVDFARALPSLEDRKVALFTTYLILTGSMFRTMRKHLKGVPESALTLQSRSIELSAADKKRLEQFVA